MHTFQRVLCPTSAFCAEANVWRVVEKLLKWRDTHRAPSMPRTPVLLDASDDYGQKFIPELFIPESGFGRRFIPEYPGVKTPEIFPAESRSARNTLVA